MDIKDLNLNTLSTYLNAYEWGKLSDDQTIDLFQALVDMGMIEHLRVEYTRVAEMLINNNRICADLNQLRQEYTAAGDSRLRRLALYSSSSSALSSIIHNARAEFVC